jgi:hypothetical protein
MVDEECEEDIDTDEWDSESGEEIDEDKEY